MATVSAKNQISDIFKRFSHDQVLRPKQEEALLNIYNFPDCDHLISLPTGYGKSVITHLVGDVLAATKGEDAAGTITVCVVPLSAIQDDQLHILKGKGLPACKLELAGGAKTTAGAQTDSDSDGTDSSQEEDVERTEKDSSDEERICETEASLKDICDGKYRVVFTHPEALLSTRFGRDLLASEQFTSRVSALVVDECHTIDTWGESFRTAFRKLYTLPAIFGCPVIAMSATLLKRQWESVPKALGMGEIKTVSASPDRPNIFYSVEGALSNIDILARAESVVIPVLQKLKELGPDCPVTVIYVPLEWCVQAQLYAVELFGAPKLGSDRYGILFSNQDQLVKDFIFSELKKEDPFLRLVFSSSTLGMGFDSPCITDIIHGKPPRTCLELVQQVGRAGRLGQQAHSLIYCNSSDLAENVVGMTDEIREFMQSNSCLREKLLGFFGFMKERSDFQTDCKCCCICATVCECESCAM